MLSAVPALGLLSYMYSEVCISYHECLLRIAREIISSAHFRQSGSALDSLYETT